MHPEKSGLEHMEQTSRTDAAMSSPAHAEMSAQPPATGRIQLVVDLNRCQAYAQCCFLAPDVFRLHGEEALWYDAAPELHRESALWYDPAPDAAQREHVLRAAAACPVQAIVVERSEAVGRQHRTDTVRTRHREQMEESHAAQRPEQRA
jgi:ferredoxin